MKETIKHKLYTLIAVLLLLVTVSAMVPRGKVLSGKKNNKNALIISQQGNLLLSDSLVTYAQEFLGTPYVYGSCSKDGFDCSGFVYYVFRHFDIEVPRTSSQYKTFGEEVPIEEVKKGDILVFLSPTRNAIGHLGIVVKANGKESEFIHATSGKAMSVVITSLTNKGYTRRFVKAIRLL